MLAFALYPDAGTQARSTPTFDHPLPLLRKCNIGRKVGRSAQFDRIPIETIGHHDLAVLDHLLRAVVVVLAQ